MCHEWKPKRMNRMENRLSQRSGCRQRLVRTKCSKRLVIKKKWTISYGITRAFHRSIKYSHSVSFFLHILFIEREPRTRHRIPIIIIILSKLDSGFWYSLGPFALTTKHSQCSFDNAFLKCQRFLDDCSKKWKISQRMKKYPNSFDERKMWREIFFSIYKLLWWNQYYAEWCKSLHAISENWGKIIFRENYRETFSMWENH